MQSMHSLMNNFNIYICCSAIIPRCEDDGGHPFLVLTCESIHTVYVLSGEDLSTVSSMLDVYPYYYL